MSKYNQILTEKDLEYIFGAKRKKRKLFIVSTVYSIALFVFFVCLIFTALNFNSLRLKLGYWYATDYSSATSSVINESTVNPNNLANADEDEKVVFDSINNNYLKISSINVLAPITWNIPNTPSLTSQGLQNGLIQIDGTAHPGEIGNVFITGHSSNYPWAKGDFNNIFALLNKVVVGDQIQVKYQDQNYLYTVKETKVVQPTDISVLQPTKNSILTLMTCTPVGTSLRRLIVISEQVYPNPANNAPSNTKTFNATEIPKAR
jgi:LPXTG-site transpeptidase (sortase) family protein